MKLPQLANPQYLDAIQQAYALEQMADAILVSKDRDVETAKVFSALLDGAAHYRKLAAQALGSK